MESKSITVGAVQFDVKLGDVEANLAAVSRRLKRLADTGVDLAVLPEMWSSGFDNENIAEHARNTPEILGRVRELAAGLSMAVAGSMPEPADNGVYNTFFMVDKTGGITAAYRKAHLFPLTREPAYFLAGDKAVHCDVSGFSTGLMICYDLRFPELARCLTLNGARLLLVCAQWPLARVGHWRALLTARAVENQVFVVGTNRCGEDPDLRYGGHSMILSPWGDVLAQAGEECADLTATLEPGLVDRAREALPCLDRRAPHVYG